jgi:hypothetical protein
MLQEAHVAAYLPDLGCGSTPDRKFFFAVSANRSLTPVLGRLNTDERLLTEEKKPPGFAAVVGSFLESSKVLVRDESEGALDAGGGTVRGVAAVRVELSGLVEEGLFVQLVD